MNMSNFDQTRLHRRRKILAGFRGGGVSKGDPKMDDIRSVREATHIVGGAANSERRHDTSEPPPSVWPKVRTERVLSLDSVIDDMRATLWPERRDHELTETESLPQQSRQT
jgi:hypothetical protein